MAEAFLQDKLANPNRSLKERLLLSLSLPNAALLSPVPVFEHSIRAAKNGSLRVAEKWRLLWVENLLGEEETGVAAGGRGR